MFSLSISAQSEYLTEKRLAFELQGSISKSSDLISTGLGLSFSLKSAVDMEINFGNVSDSETDQSGDFVSFFSTLYLANQRLGSGANFGIIFGGSDINYDAFKITSYGGGFTISGRKNLTDKTGLIPSATFLYFPINDATSDDSEGNFGEPFGSISLKFGAFKNYNSNNFLFLEPSLSFNTENNEPGISINLGVIF